MCVFPLYFILFPWKIFHFYYIYMCVWVCVFFHFLFFYYFNSYFFLYCIRFSSILLLFLWFYLQFAINFNIFPFFFFFCPNLKKLLSGNFPKENLWKFMKNENLFFSFQMEKEQCFSLKREMKKKSTKNVCRRKCKSMDLPSKNCGKFFSKATYFPCFPWKILNITSYIM